VRNICREKKVFEKMKEDEYEYVFLKLSRQKVDPLLSKLSQENLSPEKALEIMKNEWKTLKNEEESQIKEKKAKELEQQKQIKKVEWTDEEIALMTKAIAKIPGGTPQRWEKIAAYIGTNKTVKDVLDRATESKSKR
jgi:hypothetical protein